MNIAVAHKETNVTIPVRINYVGGYTIIGGMSRLAQGINVNMSESQRIRYEFVQAQLGRKSELEEC